MRFRNMTHDIGISVCIGAGGSMADTGNAVNTAYKRILPFNIFLLDKCFSFFEMNTALEKNIITCLFRSNRQYRDKRIVCTIA